MTSLHYTKQHHTVRYRILLRQTNIAFESNSIQLWHFIYIQDQINFNKSMQMFRMQIIVEYVFVIVNYVNYFNLYFQLLS